MQSITGMSSPIHLLDWLAKRNKYCSFLATISYHLAYWSSTLIASWKCQWLDWMKFHRMLMRITLPNELCTVLESTLFKGYFFFITSKLAWNSFFSNTFSEYLGVSNQSKTLFTWSGGTRSSGVGFFCFVSHRAWKQKKPTPLDRGPPLHVNRP